MKRMVAIGAVVLAVGIVMVIGGAVGALGSLTIKTSFAQPQPGEYVSAEISLNTTSTLVVSSPAASGGVVHAQDLNSVNSTNINNYAISYNTSGAGSDIYSSLSGDYYYVAFSSTQPNTKIVVTQGSLATTYGGLALLGIVLAISGVIVMVIGVRQKRRPQGPG